MAWTPWLVLGGAVGAAIAIVGLSKRLDRDALRMERFEHERHAQAAREARNVALLQRQIAALEEQVKAQRVHATQASRTADTRVEDWIARESSEGGDSAGWGTAELEHLERVLADGTRRLADRIRAGSGLLVKRTSEVLAPLLASEDPRDVAAALGAWATSTEREAARRHLAEQPRAQAALAAWLRMPGEPSRSTAMWLLHGAGAWARSLLPALRDVLREPPGNQDASALREWTARQVASHADAESEPLLAGWAVREPDPRQRGWILYHLVALHEALRPAGTGSVPDATIASLLDAALANAGVRQGGEHYVVPVMALSAVGEWPRWLEGRSEAVRRLTEGGASLERDGAARALLKAGDPWALERLAGWLPTLGSWEVLLDLGPHLPAERLDALIVGALGPAARAPGSYASGRAWPEKVKLLDYLRSRAGRWEGFPEALRDLPGIREVHDPTLRFDGNPALLAHLETLKGGILSDLSDAWLRWLLAREGVPAEEVEQAVRLRRALDASSPEALLETAGRLLACPAARRAPQAFPIERARWESAGGR